MVLVFDVLVFEIGSHLTQVGLKLVIYLGMTLNSDSPVFYLPSVRIISVFTMLSTIGYKTPFMLSTIILHSKPNLQPILVYFYKNSVFYKKTLQNAKRVQCFSELTYILILLSSVPRILLHINIYTTN